MVFLLFFVELYEKKGVRMLDNIVLFIVLLLIISI